MWDFEKKVEVDDPEGEIAKMVSEIGSLPGAEVGFIGPRKNNNPLSQEVRRELTEKFGEFCSEGIAHFCTAMRQGRDLAAFASTGSDGAYDPKRGKLALAMAKVVSGNISALMGVAARSLVYDRLAQIEGFEEWDREKVQRVSAQIDGEIRAGATRLMAAMDKDSDALTEEIRAEIAVRNGEGADVAKDVLNKVKGGEHDSGKA